MKINYDELFKKLGYEFKNTELLIRALTHRSYANEHQFAFKDNERLEFLGDSVLNLVSTEYIISKFPVLTEGQLSKIKGQLISEKAFSNIANEINLGKFLLLSNGEDASGGRQRASMLADALEALMGAIFLDSDYYTVREIALKYLKKIVDDVIKTNDFVDYKSQFQEYTQKKYKLTPVYELIDTKGPDHDKSFEVAVYIQDKKIASAIEKSKKKAEKAAAKNALILLKELK